jgi:hypothetical protein
MLVLAGLLAAWGSPFLINVASLHLAFAVGARVLRGGVELAAPRKTRGASFDVGRPLTGQGLNAFPADGAPRNAWGSAT